MNVIDYIREEVRRQGHDEKTIDGIERVGWMLDAWSYAIWSSDKNKKPTIRDMMIIGGRVERDMNRGGFRKVPVFVGDNPTPHPDAIDRLISKLWESIDILTPIEFYKAYEEIHPWCDGNGRSGKIILNWLNGSLLDPIFPPSDIFGYSITNP